MTPKVMVFASDLSTRSDRAMDRVHMLAAEWGARLVVLHALREPSPTTTLPSWRRPADPGALARRRILEDIDREGGIDVEVLIERGDPAQLILETAQRTGATLIITGTERDDLLVRAGLGSTINTVVRRATVPVLTVKTRPRRPYSEVVVATDFSEGSRAAFVAALSLLPEARVSLLHGYDIPFETLADDRGAAREAAEAEARRECHEFIRGTPSADGRGVAVLCEYGSPATLLQDLDHAGRVDLAVIGTEGRGGLPRLLLGSVAEHLLSALPMDVMTVRRPRA